MKATEIEFRGIVKNGSKFIYGDLNHIDDKVYIFPRDGNANDSPDNYEVESETVGQYTNRYSNDKHKVRLYQGDNVSVIKGSVNGVIVFDIDHFAIKVTKILNKEKAFPRGIEKGNIVPLYQFEYLNFLGNIHQK